MQYRTSLFLVLMLNGVWTSHCCTEDLKNVFSSSASQCNGEETWTFRHSKGDINSLDLLTPGIGKSCISSHILPMNGGDSIEVNVFAELTAKEDFVAVIVYDAVENKAVGRATLSSEGDAKNGWSVMKILLDGTESFNGYIALTGEASVNSILQVESVCYSSVRSKEQSKLNEDITNLRSINTSPNIYELETGSFLNAGPDAFVDEVDFNYLENNAERFINLDDFSWTPIWITLAVVIPAVILSLIAAVCWCCYALGKRRGAKQEPEVIYEDVNNIPKPYLVPRVKSAYAESVNGSTYGGRVNNVYSV